MKLIAKTFYVEFIESNGKPELLEHSLISTQVIAELEEKDLVETSRRIGLENKVAEARATAWHDIGDRFNITLKYIET